MYPIVNKTSPFVPYDICQVVGTNELVVIDKIDLNTCQKTDGNQWTFSILKINPASSVKSAWYNADELKYINNLFVLMARNNSQLDSELAKLRRKND